MTAQSRKELESKRNKLQAEIKEAAKLLEKTTKAQKSELQRFNLVQSQIQKREELIQTIYNELKLVEAQISANKKETEKLEKEIQKLYSEYTAIIQKTYRLQLGSSKSIVLLSSKNINQALQRWTYINQIKNVRKEQSQNLQNKISELNEKKSQLENFRNQKSLLLKTQEKQKEQLNQELQEKNKLIENLRKDEAKIRQTIKEKEVAREKLNAEIQKMIALEIEKQKKEAEERAKKEAEERAKKEAQRKKEAEKAKAKEESSPKSAANPKETPSKTEPAKLQNLPETPESRALSESFASNKGKLPWPVHKGTISRKFGAQAHPLIPNITITNNGINIRTEVGAAVRSVFKGEVVGKRFIPGYDYLVMVKHGNYYTIYSNLSEVSVKEGQKINTGEILGKASADEDEVFSEIHFEIWNDKVLQDPTHWLKM